MHDPRIHKLADVLVNYCTRVKKGDLVAVRGDPLAMPLIESVFEQVLRAGGHPFWTPMSETLQEIVLTHATPEQLAYVSPLDLHRIDTIDVQISLWAEGNTRFLSRIDPSRVAAQQSARKAWLTRFMKRAAEGQLRWVGTQYPTTASAQDAERSLSQYADFVFRAGLLHLPDPVAEWKKIRERQQRVCDFLQKRKVVRFRTPPGDGHDGTDLSVDVHAATWINCSGLENFPDGEVFAGPQSVNGHVNYTFPAVYSGREVEGVRLVFRDGRVVDASARKNQDFLLRMLDLDRGARTMGEIAIGTNYNIAEFSKNTLFDEKIGGTFHAAVGAGYPESGNSNDSALHWDMVCDLRHGGTIEADGELFHKNGRFLQPGWPGND